MSKHVYHSIHFKAPPQLASVLMLEGQRYKLVKIEPYVRKDGLASWILHWQSHCPKCAKAFVATSALRSKNVNRRCPKHHKPGKRVSSNKPRAKRYQSKSYCYRKKTTGGR